MTEGYTENRKETDLQEISTRYSQESTADFKYPMGRVANDLVEGNSLSIADSSLISLLSTRRTHTLERYFSPIEKKDFKIVEYEVAKHVLNFALSEKPEDVVNYDNFFLLKPDLNEEEYNSKDRKVDRVVAAHSILEILEENNQEDPALTQKFFYDIYLKSLQSVRERDIPLLDIDLAWNLANFFEKAKNEKGEYKKSKFYNEENTQVLREELYRLIDKTFKVSSSYHLAQNNGYLSKLLTNLCNSSWFLNEEKEEWFLENKELQTVLIKTDIQARRRKHDENFETPLTVLKDNIEGYKERVEDIRRPMVLESVTRIFNVLDKMKDGGDNAELYEMDNELVESTRNLIDYYRSDYSKVMVEVLNELTEVDSEILSKSLLPLVNGLINEINRFYESEINDSNIFIENSVRSYMSKLGEQDSKINSVDKGVQFSAFIKEKIRKNFQSLRFMSLASEEVVIEEIEIFDNEAATLFEVEDAIEKVGGSIEFDKEQFETLIKKSKNKTEKILNNYQFIRELLRLYGSEYNPSKK